MISRVKEIKLAIKLFHFTIEVIIQDKFKFSNRRVCIIYEYGIDGEALEIVGCSLGKIN
jgi:hypothetical protein